MKGWDLVGLGGVGCGFGDVASSFGGLRLVRAELAIKIDYLGQLSLYRVMISKASDVSTGECIQFRLVTYTFFYFNT